MNQINLVINILLLFSGVFGGVVKKDREGFLEGTVKTPEIVGKHGTIVKIDEKPTSSRDNDNAGAKKDFNNLLGKILETVNAKKSVVVSDAANVNKVPRENDDKPKKQKLSFTQLEKALDNLILEMSDQNSNVKKDTLEKSTNDDFKDFDEVKEKKNKATDNNVMSFEDFKENFYKMFFNSQGNKNPVEKKRSYHTKVRNDLSDVYNELKAETKKETEKKRMEKNKKIAQLKKEVDFDLKKEEKKEAKKVEIVKLLNDIVGSKEFFYNDGRVQMNKDRMSERHSNSAEQDFKRLVDHSDSNSMEDYNEVYPRISHNAIADAIHKKKELNTILRNIADVLKPRDENNEKIAETSYFVDDRVDDPGNNHQLLKSLPLPKNTKSDTENEREEKLKDVLLNINDVLTTLVKKEKSSENDLAAAYEKEEMRKRNLESEDVNGKLRELLGNLKDVMKRSLNSESHNENRKQKASESAQKFDKEFLDALRGFTLAQNKGENS